MPDYQKSKIYRIVCDTTGDVYYGSTAMADINARKSNHISSVKMFDAGIVQKKCASYEIIKRGDWLLEVVEEFPCSSKRDLEGRERFYMENNKCINIKRPLTTYDETLQERRQRYQDNKEKEKAQMQLWRDNNKDRKAAADKAYREGDKRDEVLAKKREYHHSNKEAISQRAKEYREKNREVIMQKKREYYEKNKEAIQQQRQTQRALRKSEL